MKVCKNCDEAKPLDEFHHSSITKDGRQGKCKICRCAGQRAYYAATRDTQRDKQRAYYKANSEIVKAAASRDYYANHAERKAARRRYHRDHWSRIYAAKKGYYQEKAREYYRANSGRWLTYNARRRATIGDVDPGLEDVIARMLVQSCGYCGATEDIEIDHIVPLARGGRHELSNLAPACRPCNRSKGSKLPFEWVAL